MHVSCIWFYVQEFLLLFTYSLRLDFNMYVNMLIQKENVNLCFFFANIFMFAQVNCRQNGQRQVSPSWVTRQSENPNRKTENT